MDLEPDAVAETVRERVAEARVGDHRPRGGVDLRRRRTWADGLDAGPLRGRDDVVDRSQSAVRLAERHRPGHVRVVALGEGAEVELHDVAPLERPVPRVVMRLGRGAGRTRRSTRSSGPPRRRPASPTRAHARPRARCVPRAAPRQHDPLERDVGELLRARDQGHLVRILRATEPLDLRPRRDEVDPLGRVGQLLPLLVGQPASFEPRARDPERPAGIDQRARIPLRVDRRSPGRAPRRPDRSP